MHPFPVFFLPLLPSAKSLLTLLYLLGKSCCISERLRWIQSPHSFVFAIPTLDTPSSIESQLHPEAIRNIIQKVPRSHLQPRPSFSKHSFIHIRKGNLDRAIRSAILRAFNRKDSLSLNPGTHSASTQPPGTHPHDAILNYLQRCPFGNFVAGQRCLCCPNEERSRLRSGRRNSGGHCHRTSRWRFLH